MMDKPEIVIMENIKPGVIITRLDKKFLVLKVNVKTFYAQEILKDYDLRTLLDKFQSKSRSYSMKDYCRDTGVFISEYDGTFFLSKEDKPIVSNKEIKQKKIGVSPCCGHAAASAYKYKKRNYTGRARCRTCAKEFNIVKLEPDNWLSFSQNMAWYQVNLVSGDVKFLRKMGEVDVKVEAVRQLVSEGDTPQHDTYEAQAN